MSTPTSVDEYLAGAPDDARATLQELRGAVKEAAPDAAEVISYQIPLYKLGGKHLVAFGGWKRHCGFYVMSEAVIEEHKAELTAYSKEKTTIHFPIGEPIPRELVGKLVKARVAEVSAASTKKG